MRAYLCLPLIVVAACSSSSPQRHVTSEQVATIAFRDAQTEPTAGWTGPVFKLSHDYPTALPPDGDKMPWLSLPVDFEDRNPMWTGSKWPVYMQQVLDYIKEGQDPMLSDDKGFIVQVGAKTRWFHMPWMAYDDTNGRDFIHGLTNERIATTQDLDGDGDGESTGVGTLTGTSGFFETWSVGMYNDYGGYSIGRAFTGGTMQLTQDSQGKALLDGTPFPVGTVVAKLLFTSASDMDVFFLAGSPAWRVDRHKYLGKGSNFSCKREVQVSHLLQMDIAVVDPRSPTGWVYGTFAYDGKMPGASVWERMAPVGVQWGNDVQAFPASPDKMATIYQSVPNKNINTYQHLGCNGRLNGPADNPKSSCLACHMGAFAAPINQLDELGKNLPPLFGYPTQCTADDMTNRELFANRKFPERLTQYPDAIPLDSSLQFLVASSEYKSFVLTGKPLQCVEAK